jgi:aspartyl-tRNA(Asn)/glutamyl-tRNA(Gln) amidotransferase subunit C
MKISRQEVARIADLARLKLTDEKLDLFAGQLNDILEYMEMLGQVDTSQVEPLSSPVEHEASYRDDEVEQGFSRDEVLRNAPEDDGAFFIVPKVF